MWIQAKRIQCELVCDLLGKRFSSIRGGHVITYVCGRQGDVAKHHDGTASTNKLLSI